MLSEEIHSHYNIRYGYNQKEKIIDGTIRVIYFPAQHKILHN